MLIVAVTYLNERQVFMTSADNMTPYEAMLKKGLVLIVNDGLPFSIMSYDEDLESSPTGQAYHLSLDLIQSIAGRTITSATSWTGLFNNFTGYLNNATTMQSMTKKVPVCRFISLANGRQVQCPVQLPVGRPKVFGGVDNPFIEFEVKASEPTTLRIRPQYNRYRYISLINSVPLLEGFASLPIARTSAKNNQYLEIEGGTDYLENISQRTHETQLVDFSKLFGQNHPHDTSCMSVYTMASAIMTVITSGGLPAIRVTLPSAINQTNTSLIFSLFGKLMMVDGLNITRDGANNIIFHPTVMGLGDVCLANTISKYSTLDRTITFKAPTDVTELRNLMLLDSLSCFIIVINNPHIYITVVREDPPIREEIRCFPSNANSLLRNVVTGQVIDYVPNHYSNMSTIAIQNRSAIVMPGRNKDKTRQAFLRMPNWYPDGYRYICGPYEMIDFLMAH